MTKTEKKNRPALTVAAMMAATVLSKVLGMLRSVFMASRYGTGVEVSAFNMASVVPLTFFDMLFAAAILGCFIPVYNSFKKTGDDAEDEKRADGFACIFLNTVMLASGVLAAAGILFAPQIIAALGSGEFMNDETRALAVRLLRVMFPMIIFVGGAYTLVGVMQSKGRYMLPALISSVSNGAVVVYLCFFDEIHGERGIYGLALTYVAAWVIQFLTLFLPLLRSGFKWRAALDFKNPALIRALKSAPPVMVGSWLAPVTLLSGTYFASFVNIDGNVTVLNNAYYIYTTVTGILTYSICNYVFPKLSRLSAEGDSESFSRTVRAGLLSAFAIVLPFTALLALLSGEGVCILYLRGAFTADAARATSSALGCLAAAMPAFAVVEVLSRVLYSKGVMRAPMIASVVGIVVNIAASAALVGIEPLGMRSLGIAIAAGQWAAAITLVIFTLRYLPGALERSFARSFLKLLVCTVISAAVMFGVRYLLGGEAYLSSFMRNFIVCAAVFAAGAVVYAVCCVIFRALPKRALTDKQ